MSLVRQSPKRPKSDTSPVVIPPGSPVMDLATTIAGGSSNQRTQCSLFKRLSIPHLNCGQPYLPHEGPIYGYMRQSPSAESTMGMDLISLLPDDILHTIIGYHLPTKDATRTSVLSKRWRAINYSSPFLSFNERDFLPLRKYYINVSHADILSGDFNHGKGNNIKIFHPRRQNQENLEETAARKECHDLFMNYIESRMAGLLQHESSPVEQLHLIIFNFNYDRDSSRLDLWLKHAFERRMWKLILNVFTTIFEGEEEVVYSLPSSLLVSQTLTVLKLANCKLDDASGNIKLPRLRHISLYNLDLEDDFIKCLIFGCPLLEVISLSLCPKLTIFGVTSLPQLKRVIIACCPDLECVDIQSPQLQQFQYFGYEGKTCKFNLTTSNVIKHMFLSKTRITGDWLQKQIVKCEGLTLIKVHGFEDTKLSSQKLRHLNIHCCFQITRVIEIDCPNLYSLKHYANRFLPNYVNASKLRKIVFGFSLEHYQQHASLLDILKECFGDCSPIRKFIKHIIINSEDQKDVIILDRLTCESTVPMLGEVKVIMPKARLTVSSLDVEDLVDHLCSNFWKTPHQTLTIVSTQDSITKFSQTLYDKLSRTVGKANCCDDGFNQCWRYKLSNVTKDSNSNDVPTVLKSYQSENYQISRILLDWMF